MLKYFLDMAAKTKTQEARWTLVRVLPWLLFVGGLIGTFAAGMLTYDYIKVLQNPEFRPVCNLNPIFSCSSVMTSSQAHAFGIPNELIGLPGYAALATIGLALLAGAKFKRWFWRLINIGVLFAVSFLTWLQFQTLYRIGALCLFCMILWAVTIPMFWYTTLYNFQAGNITAPGWFKRPLAFIRRHHADILILWFLIIIALILKRFWYYWQTLI
jgi:uncharacterized membrane protein